MFSCLPVFAWHVRKSVSYDSLLTVPFIRWESGIKYERNTMNKINQLFVRLSAIAIVICGCNLISHTVL